MPVAMKIAELLTCPEGKTLEFKRDISSPQPILKTLVAFANTAGGTLIIGRSSEGEIIGIEDVLDAEEKLANHIADGIRPALMPEIEITTAERKSLLVVRVAHWRSPFYLRAEGPSRGVYVRLGSTNRQAGPEMLAELQRAATNISYDQLPCPDIDEGGLDHQRIEQAFTAVDRTIDRSDLETLGILVPHAGNLVASNGGVILFGTDEARARHFPDARVSCALFRGINKADFIDRQELEGTILEPVEQVPKFIARNTRMASHITDMQRVDIPAYSVVAVREILINALVHAD